MFDVNKYTSFQVICVHMLNWMTGKDLPHHINGHLYDGISKQQE
jgi:hypothetical protein